MKINTYILVSTIVAWIASSSFSFAQIQDTGDQIRVMNQEAASLFQQGQYKQAEPLLTRLLAIQEKALGHDHSEVGTTLNNLASVHEKQGQYVQAEELFKRSLAIKEKALGANSLDVAKALNNLAGLYIKRGQYAQAEPLLQRSLAIRQKILGQSHPDVATGLNNLASLYRDQGKYAQAEALFKHALGIDEKMLGLEHPKLAIDLGNLAGLYIEQGQYAQAEPLLLRSLAINEKALGQSHPNVATGLNNLAFLYMQQSKYAQAETLFKHALAIDEKVLGPEHPKTAIDLGNLAQIYSALGQYAQAEPLLQRSLSISEKALGQFHPNVAKCLSNLALLYKDQGKYAHAEALFKRALGIDEKMLGPEHPRIATDLNNLAQTYSAPGQYEQAEALYLRSLAIREKTIGMDHPDVAVTLNNLGYLFLIERNHAKAESPLLRAWQISKNSGNPEIRWTVNANLLVLYAESKPELAIWYGKQAVNILQTVRSNNIDLGKGSQRSFLDKHESIYKVLADLLFGQGRLIEGQQMLTMLKEAEYFDFVERSSAIDPRTTQSSFTEQEESWNKRYQLFSDQHAVLTREYAALQQKEYALLSAKEKARIAELDAELTVGRQGYDASVSKMLQDLSQKNGQLASVSRQREIGTKQLGSLSALQGTLETLGNGAVILHYLMTDTRLWILLTTPTVQIVRKVNIGEAELNRLIGHYRQSITLQHPDIKKLGKNLFDILIAPVTKDLEQEKAQTLMLSLHGALRYLPVAALYDGNHYLAQKYRLVLFTEAAKDKLKDTPKPHWHFAGFGLTQKIENYTPLPFVKDELEGMVTPKFSGEIKFDKDFTASSFKSGIARRPPVVHAASHFVLKSGNESNAFLLLGDGTPLSLKAIKEGNFRFTDIDLVTLSACETAVGGGKDIDGREVEGLGALVQIQGAKGVMASLWPVADKSTGQFMQLFYWYRQKNPGVTKAEALQLAQLAFIERNVTTTLEKFGVAAKHSDGSIDTEGDTTHPFFWAPFILMGNWL